MSHDQLLNEFIKTYSEKYKFHDTNPIGEGQYAYVYKAKDIDRNIDVAIKIYKQAVTPEGAERGWSITTRIVNSQIAATYTIERLIASDGNSYKAVISKFIDGKTVKSLSKDFAVYYFLQLYHGQIQSLDEKFGEYNVIINPYLRIKNDEHGRYLATIPSFSNENISKYNIGEVISNVLQYFKDETKISDAFREFAEVYTSNDINEDQLLHVFLNNIYNLLKAGILISLPQK